MIMLLAAFAAGWATWTLFEYLLHRFAMHHLRGRGIMSREHLLHHVRASWVFDPLMILVWVGVVAAGFGWGRLADVTLGLTAGIGVGAGWVVGYFFYEYQHAMAHLRPPRTAYQRWLRRYHFQHHFGGPMTNHGVTLSFWDRVWGTRRLPAQVRVPRRLAMAWLLDEAGEVRPEFAADYALVGRPDMTDALADQDRVRAFASVAPTD